MILTHRTFKIAVWALVLLLFCVFTKSAFVHSSIEVEVEVNTAKSFGMQVFWSANQEGFGEPRSIIKNLSQGGQTVLLSLPAKHIDSLRVDFGSFPGLVDVISLRVKKGDIWQSVDLSKVAFSKDIESHVYDKGLKITSSKADPYIVYTDRDGIEGVLTFDCSVLSVLWVLFGCIVSWVVVSIVFGWHVPLSISTGDGKRDVSVDVLRVLAFGMVLLTHLLEGGHVSQSVFAGAFPFAPFATWSGIGVTFFVVLSGLSLSLGTLERHESFLLYYFRRAISILAPFWVAYLLVMIFSYVFGQIKICGSDPLKMVQTLFGLDGYLHTQYRNYYAIGEWYTGFILLLYLLAPATYRLTKKSPVIAFLLSAVVSVASLFLTPLAAKYFTFFNCIGMRNITTRLFEFVIGMSMCLYFRRKAQYYAVTTAISAFILITLSALALFHTPMPFINWQIRQVVYSICLFNVLLYVLDGFLIGNSGREVIAFFAKNSFLAFLYHHWLLGIVIKSHPVLTAQDVVYVFVSVFALSYLFAHMSSKPAALLKEFAIGLVKPKDLQGGKR